MPILQFQPIKEPHISYEIGDMDGTYISVSIKHCNIDNGVAIETGERLEKLDGNFRVYNGFNNNAQELKEEGYVGVISYRDGIENAEFYIQSNVSTDDFARLINLFSNNNIGLVTIQLPLNDKNFYYGLLPDDPIIWKVKEQSWVSIENCKIVFRLRDMIAM